MEDKISSSLPLLPERCMVYSHSLPLFMCIDCIRLQTWFGWAKFDLKEKKGHGKYI